MKEKTKKKKKDDALVKPDDEDKKKKQVDRPPHPVKHQHVDAKLVEKAVTALIQYQETQAAKQDKSQLLGTDRPLQVNFGLELAPGQASLKPIRIPIPHPIYEVTDENGNKTTSDGVEEPEVCLIVKDDSKGWVKDMIDSGFPQLQCIKKVLTLTSLRQKYGTYAQRRELLQLYDVFMADDRILPMLTKSLGKNFVKAKKLPVPLTITRKTSFPGALQRNLSSTYMTISQGTCIMVRVGNTGMPVEHLVENVVAICKAAPLKIPRKWANVRNIAIKTPDSMSLPFYHKLPEELAEIAKMAGLSPAFCDLEVEEQKKEENKKRRQQAAAEKSPLVKALKKQKKEEKKETTTSKKAEDKSESNKKKGDDENEGNDNKSTSSLDEKKKRKESESGEMMKDEDVDDNNKSAKKKRRETKNDEEDEPLASATKKRKESKNEKDEPSATPSDTKKKRKDSVSSEKSEEGGETPSKSSDKKKKKKKDKKKRKKEEDDGEDDGETESLTKKRKEETPDKQQSDDFIPSKKFKGSKKGYVFRRGNQGVGYYVDVKPVVDKMLLQALMRSTPRQNSGGGRRGGGGSSGKKRKGRR